MTIPARRRTRAWIAAARVVALAVLSGSCAPHRAPLPELDAGGRETRYRTALAARDAAGIAVDAEVSLWVRGPGGRRPGAQARLVLAGPDAFRLRVGSAFGTALDLSARGDTLTAYVPRERVGISVASSEDSLGVRGPGTLGYRFWSAAWRPPEAAWRSAAWRESLLVVRWGEAGDSLELSVGSSGLPSSLVFAPRSGSPVSVRYRAWEAAQRVPWPSILELEEGARELSLTCRVQRVRFARRADRARVALRLPAEAERLSRANLRRALERLGEL